MKTTGALLILCIALYNAEALPAEINENEGSKLSASPRFLFPGSGAGSGAGVFCQASCRWQCFWQGYWSGYCDINLEPNCQCVGPRNSNIPAPGLI